MDLKITLSDVEVGALTAERLSDKELLEDVIHRLVAPLVKRLIADKFAILRVAYDALDLSSQVDIIAALEILAAQHTKS